MNKRTEDDKVTQAPLEVILGGKKYSVKLLVIKDSRQWRKEVTEGIASFSKYTQVTMDDTEKFGGAIKQMLSVMPDTVIDLVFKYAKDLDREFIESVATDAEMEIAFGQMVDVAFPLSRSLVGTMTRLSQ